MALAAAEKEHGELDEETAERVKAMSAATDNVGLFFGEDIFLAISSILLIQGALAGFGIQLTPFQLSVWAIPSAICAFVIHGARLLLDRIRRSCGARGDDRRCTGSTSSPARSSPASRSAARATGATRSAGATPLSGRCSRSASGSAISSAISATACSSSRWSRSPARILLGRSSERVRPATRSASASRSASATSCSCRR